MNLTNDINSFLYDSGRRGLSKNTIRLYQTVLYEMNKNLNDWIDLVGGVQHHIECLHGKPGTVDVKTTIIKRFFNWSIKRGLCRTNPTDSVESVKFTNERIRYLTTEEVNLLLDCCDPTMKVIVSIALLTGLRRSAIFELKHDEVDLIEKRITVQSKGKIHRVPITVPLHKVFLENRGLMSGHPVYCFPNKKGTGPLDNNAVINFRKACVKAGINDFRFHDLRHTFATNFLKATRNLYMLQSILGHSSINMTQRYAHVLEEDRINAMDTFAESLLPRPANRDVFRWFPTFGRTAETSDHTIRITSLTAS